MQKTECRLTVYFADPFWVGVYERVCDTRLEACKITFGAEPKDYQVHAYLLDHWHELRFSPPVPSGQSEARRPNPKRMQRAIQRQLACPGTSTKSQQALSLQREEAKSAAKQNRRLQKEMDKQQKYELRAKKRREKRRGTS